VGLRRIADFIGQLEARLSFQLFVPISRSPKSGPCPPSP